MLLHRASLRKFKTGEIFSDHHERELEISHSRHPTKYAHAWRLDNMTLNEQWLIGKITIIKKEMLDLNKMVVHNYLN